MERRAAVDFLRDDELLAAIDIGSNSIHLAIARVDHGEVRKVASLSEKVQLAAGLDENNYLSESAQGRGLACLGRFVGRLAGVPPERIRIVATNALRQATNADDFMRQAQAILPKPIEVIAGREEARLIYLGVSHTMAGEGRRLVVDIGGGSTEFIVGEDFEPLLTESLQMGCVAFTQRFFPDGSISKQQFARAQQVAEHELMAIAEAYRREGWNSVLGSSGTIKAARQLLVALGLSDDQERITRSGLEQLTQRVLQHRHVGDLDFACLKEDRRAVLPAGLAILSAVFKVLDLEHMAYSDGALREGVMYDLLGRFRHEDIRDRSVQALMARYHVDQTQAQRVVRSARELFDQVSGSLGLSDEWGDLLRRAAYLHEVGLAISHAGYQRHGAYLLANSDIPGFSQVDQARLAQLVGNHRRKLKDDSFDLVRQAGGQSLVQLSLLLRLAVLLHHARTPDAVVQPALTTLSPKHWTLSLPKTAPAWLWRDLEGEVAQWDNWGMQLSLNPASLPVD